MRTRVQRESMAAHLEDVANDLADISFELSGEGEMPRLGSLTASGAAKLIYIARELRDQTTIKTLETQGGSHGENQEK